jgi:hypothetical protein
MKIWDAESGTILFTYFDAIHVAALYLDGAKILAGMRAGGVHLLSLENNPPPDPPVLTAWDSPTLSFGCPFCRTWPTVSESVFGKAASCPRCKAYVKFNSFAIHADWRPIAKAWGND